MTQVSMHAASAPLFVRMLKNLSAMLDKAEAHAKAKNYDPANLLTARLAPDMFTLTRQVQIATDHAKGALARLAGQEPTPMADTEASFDDLRARIARTIALVEAVQPGQLAGAEDREIVIKIPNAELKFSGLDYLTTWAIPNFFFHLTTAYAILRHNGVEIGKRDYLMS